MPTGSTVPVPLVTDDSPGERGLLAKVLSAAVLGIDAYEVEVEVDLSPGLPAFTTVGLPDAAVKESRDRVAAAVKNTGFQFPVRKPSIKYI